MTWKNVSLGEVIRLKRGHDLPNAERIPGDIPVVSSSGITGYHNAAKCQGPGVVTGRYGTLGAVHYIDKDYWPLNTALYVEDFKGNSPRFVAYLLSSLELGAQNAAGAVPGVNRNTLHMLTVKVPDVDTQKRIAEVLSTYDSAVANSERRIAVLEDAARSLYREWFVHLRFPGHESVPVKDGVPEGWRGRLIDEVCDAVGGGTPSTARPEYWNGDVTWVTPTDVTRNAGLVLLHSEKKISESGLRNSSAKLVPPETILMTSRASIGFFALMDSSVCTNQGFISVIPGKPHWRMFLLFHLLSRVEEMNALATGSTFKELSKKAFRALSILWPPEELLARFDELVYEFIKQERVLKQQSYRLTQARDLLLPKLMSGQLDVSRIPLPHEVAA